MSARDSALEELERTIVAITAAFQAELAAKDEQIARMGGSHFRSELVLPTKATFSQDSEPDLNNGLAPSPTAASIYDRDGPPPMLLESYARRPALDCSDKVPSVEIAFPSSQSANAITGDDEYQYVAIETSHRGSTMSSTSVAPAADGQSATDGLENWEEI